MKILIQSNIVEQLIRYKQKPNKLNNNSNIVKLIASESGTLTAEYGDIHSSYTTSTPCTVKEAGEIAIDRFDLLKAVKPFSGIIAFRIKDNALIISQKKKYVKVPTLDEYMLDTLKPNRIEFTTISKRDWLLNLKRASGCTHTTLPKASGVWVEIDKEHIKFVSTNAHTLYYSRLPGVIPESILIPTNQLASVLKFLNNYEEIKIQITNKALVLKGDDVDIASIPITKEFITYQKLIPEDLTKNRFKPISLDLQIMKEAVQLVESFATKTEKGGEAAIQVALTPNGLLWSNLEENKNRVLVTQEGTFTDKALLQFNALFLKSILSEVSNLDLYATTTGKDPSYLVQDPSCFFLISPMV